MPSAERITTFPSVIIHRTLTEQVRFPNAYHYRYVAQAIRRLQVTKHRDLGQPAFSSLVANFL